MKNPRGIGDYEIGIRYLEKADENNDLCGADWLGYCYFHGKYGVEQDYRKAVYYLKKGAEGGYHDSKKYLGYCYGTGTGVEKNLEKSLSLLNEVCYDEDYEDGEAFYFRGCVYRDNKIDSQKAINSFKQAKAFGYEP